MNRNDGNKMKSGVNDRCVFIFWYKERDTNVNRENHCHTLSTLGSRTERALYPMYPLNLGVCNTPSLLPMATAKGS